MGLEIKLSECAGNMQVLRKPYTPEEIAQKMDVNGYISGIVQIPLNNIIHNDFEELLDEISEKLIGCCLLSDIGYSLAGVMDDNVLVKVTGNTDNAIEEKEIW